MKQGGKKGKDHGFAVICEADHRVRALGFLTLQAPPSPSLPECHKGQKVQSIPGVPMTQTHRLGEGRLTQQSLSSQYPAGQVEASVCVALPLKAPLRSIHQWLSWNHGSIHYGPPSRLPPGPEQIHGSWQHHCSLPHVCVSTCPLFTGH